MHKKHHSLLKRLLPLYLGMFFQGLVFWYAIEKIFMVEIGFNSETIGIAVAVYCATALITEIPSGILADRWSRRGVLMISSIALAFGSFVGAISFNIPIYLSTSIAWGIFIAMNSGTVESIIYDTLLEEYGDADSYERQAGKIEIICSSAYIIGSIFGGIIGQFIGLRETYWLSVPTAIISIFFFWMFKEPRLHKQNQDKSLLKHIKLTFGSIFKNNNLIWIMTSLISLLVVWTIIMEMGQIWLIALAIPIIMFGPVHALMTSIFGFSGLIAPFMKSTSNIFLGMFISLVSLLCLVYSRNTLVFIIAIFLIMLITYAINIVITHKLHDNLPSQVRAGSASAISALRRLLVIPISIIFGAIATKYSIFNASWLLIAILLIAIISFIFANYNQKNKVKND